MNKKLIQNQECDSDDTKYYDVTKSPFSLHGVFYDEESGRFLRIPQKIADSVNGLVSRLNANTAGGRVRFSTNSDYMTLSAKYSELFTIPHMTLRGSAGFSLCANTEKEEKFICVIGPEYTDKTGFIRRVPLPKGARYYTLYFPLYNNVNRLLLGFDKGATVEAGLPYKDIPPVLYYGSSITQGGCANRPDTSYQGQICHKNNVDFVNFGFSSGALAEPQMIDYLATVNCSIAVFDYDHNAPDLTYLKKTHYAMYKHYRNKRPDTPIVFISKPDFHADAEAKARLNVIFNTRNRAMEEGDDNVYVIDGRTFFGKDWNVCTVDGTHPTDLGFYKMAKKIGKVIETILCNQTKKQTPDA